MVHKIEFSLDGGKLEILDFPQYTAVSLVFTKEDGYTSFEVLQAINNLEVCASTHPTNDAKQVVTFTLCGDLNATVTTVMTYRGYLLLVRLLNGFDIEIQAGPDLSAADPGAKGGK